LFTKKKVGEEEEEEEIPQQYLLKRTRFLFKLILKPNNI